MLRAFPERRCLTFFLATPGFLVAVVWVLSFQVSGARPDNKTVEIVVDAQSGLDTNLGTPDRPVKTISQAAQLAIFNRRNGISTKVTIRPGTYREFVQMTNVGPETGASISFEASQIGAVILSGSDIWTDWRPDPSNPGTYVHPWQYRWGPCERPRGWPAIGEVGLHREMIFVNGTPMTQALSRSEMKQGSFFVDEVNGVVSLWPLPETGMSAASIEVAVRPGVFESDGMSNLSLKGLVLEHANSCLSTKPNAALVISGGTNNLVEDTAIVWNNWIGFDDFSSAGSTARRVTSNWNGEMGINGYRLKNAKFEDVETSHNNWRGAEGRFTGWEPSGGKFLRTHGATFQNYKAFGNQGRGMWFDTDNLDITIDRATIEQNLVGGIDLEASMGPVLIQSSRICDNLGEGIQGNQTDSVTLTGNVIYNNGRAQIRVADIQAPRTGTNWETKQAFSANSDFWVLSQNTIVGADAKQFVYGTLRLPNQGPGTFLNTLKSDRNLWFNPETPDTFEIDPGAAGRPARVLNFAQWQSTTGQDKLSKFAPPASDPAAACAIP
ncbi:MAG TPA: right-handed parallel beta-helix repeat-containing protein [Candidatus Micrarchaeia archaeon]|nr:right-handed parallel beta-helix repeat-containing protein [Candidatus Micrarchaeia archaeon]